MKWPAYPEYRASGVQWLDAVPLHWRFEPLKYVATINDEALQDSCDPTYEFDYVDIGGVDATRGIIASECLVFEDAPSRARRIVKPGDTIVSTVRTYLRAMATIEPTDRPLIVSTGFAVIRPKMIESRYLSYVLRESRFVENVMACSGGVSYPAVKPSDVAALFVTIPSEQEQRHIADFLDLETARIDALIAKKRELIERLRERRSALISRTVTRGLPADAAAAAGLDPDPPLKDSGVDWIGNVPEHWKVGNIRRFAQMRTGHTPSRQNSEYWDDCDIPWFTLTDVWQLRDGRRKHLGETAELISATGLANSAAELLPAGTVVLSRTASVGFSGIMPRPMATSQDFWNWIPGEQIGSDFLLYLLRAMQGEFQRLVIGSTHKTIYRDDAAGLAICVPPLLEQDHLVAFLDPELESIDALRDKIEAVIVALREYRSAMITAAVTGKIDVRGWQAGIASATPAVE